jgi:hypothetical protein
MEEIPQGMHIPNSQNPEPHAPMYYGNQTEKHPTNTAAKKVHPAEIMRAVNHGE